MLPWCSLTLKDWDARKGKEHMVQSVIQRGNMALSAIKQAFLFSVNPPPIPELGAVGGFDFRLQDRSNQGRDKLMEARNMLLGMAAQNPNLAGVRPEGQEPAPQLLLEIDRVKARALSVDLADLNTTLQSTLGISYINDFVRSGRILRVQMQADADLRKTPEDVLRLPIRNTKGQMLQLGEIATPTVAGRPAQGGSLQRLAVIQDRRRSRTRQEHRRRNGSDGGNGGQVAAGLRLRMVVDFAGRKGLRQPGAFPVRPLADRGLPWHLLRCTRAGRFRSPCCWWCRWVSSVRLWR